MHHSGLAARLIAAEMAARARAVAPARRLRNVPATRSAKEARVLRRSLHPRSTLGVTPPMVASFATDVNPNGYNHTHAARVATCYPHAPLIQH